MPLRRPHPLACAAAALLVIGSTSAMSAQPSYGVRYAQDRAEIKKAVASSPIVPN